ncbi:hypothetical protein OIU77_000228 [Salix suchowensis]|uniref:GB1/RHD3-type G domain-containing protein n=1 Tax=Salix suchowensis TaxID=1278906 RepID=A0ABQ9B6U3_9ROSI|nr:hypothetical protein OIU77_000228 [Salix suchowensis]
MEEGMQLIDENGKFNVDGLQDFVTATEFAQSGLSYAIVAIIGSQSSGKSTLLNQTFHTKFKEMDAYNGRSQTTKGIWIAKCSDIDPFTIVMDFEGTDSNQRGEVTLRAFYYFSVALLIERGFMVILYSFQLL